MSTYNAYRYRSNKQVLEAINNSRRLYGMPEISLGVFRYLCKTRCSDMAPATRVPRHLWDPQDAEEIEERLWDYEYNPHEEKDVSLSVAAKMQHDSSDESLSNAEKAVMTLAAEVSGLSLEEYIWRKGLKTAKSDVIKVFDILRNL